MKSASQAGCLALLLAGTGSAAAFDSWEHERLGNLAFHVARLIHCKQNGTESKEVCKELRFHDLLDENPTGDAAKLTYGTAVRCVDYFLTPEKMIAGHEDRIFFGAEGDKPRQQREGAVPTGPADYLGGIDFRRHCESSWFNPAASHAAHSNHAHFQAELVTSQHTQHLLALSISQRGNAFGALFVNAISDHYLHDFFAPGHVATIRSHMSDIYSNAIHDSINHSGARLRYDPERYRKLLEGLLPASSTLQLSKDAKKYLATNAKLDVDRNATDFGDCSGDCGELSEDEQKWLAGATLADVLWRPYAQRKADPGAGGGFHIPLRGDGELWRASQWQQRLLMLALQTQSILDVLRVYKTPADISNTFSKPTWQSETLPKEGGAAITASLEGTFFYHMRFLDFSKLPFVPFAKRERDETVDANDDVVELAGLQGSALWLRPNSHRELILSVGINHEMPRFGRMQQRESLSVEAPLGGFLRTGTTKVSAGLAAGAFVFSEKRRMGQGLSLRPGLVLSQSETFLSLPFRWFQYNIAGAHSTKNSYGVRVDQGFSSFFTVYLEMNRSQFMQEDHSFRKGSVFGAGVVFAFPLCRIYGIGKTCYSS